MRLLFLLLLFSSPIEAQWWKVQTSGLDTNLRGVSAAYAPDSKGVPVPVVWACGSNGVILRSIDEGKTWKRLHVAGGDALDFRGIAAFNATTAYVMSSGEGEKSRIYKTTDGGETWKLQYTDKRKTFFLDALSCDSEKYCAALSDPVDGKFLLLFTADGEHWNPLPSKPMPAALPGEGAFAASGTCMHYEDEEIVFGTGGARVARVFHSRDRGRTWTVVDTPLASGIAFSGIFSLALGNEGRLVAVGGDYKEPSRPYHTAAYSLDGGKTWQLAAQQPGGYRSAVAWVHGDAGLWVAVGPTGEDVSVDFGVHWKHTDGLNLNAAAIPELHTGWAVGPNGTIAVFVNHMQYEIRRREPDREQPTVASGVAEQFQKVYSPALKRRRSESFLIPRNAYLRRQ
jgi:photosystem II stability/assembly factor-like uncharacterized protein